MKKRKNKIAPRYRTQKKKNHLLTESNYLQHDDRNVDEKETKETTSACPNIMDDLSLLCIRVAIIAANCTDNSPSADERVWEGRSCRCLTAFH